MIYTTITYCSSNKLQTFINQNDLISSDFTDDELNNLSNSITNFLKQNNIIDPKIKSSDKIISILSFLQDTAIIKGLSEDKKTELREIVSNSLSFNNQDKILSLSYKILYNMINNVVDINLINVYCAIYMQIFLFLLNNSNGYELFFSYCVDSGIWDKTIDFIRNFDKKEKVTNQERELYESILSISSLAVFPAENYYEILFQYKDKFINESNNTCQKLGDFIETIAIIQTANDMSTFILDTIGEKIIEYTSIYANKKDPSIISFCRYLYFLRDKCEYYKNMYGNR